MLGLKLCLLLLLGDDLSMLLGFANLLREVLALGSGGTIRRFLLKVKGSMRGVVAVEQPQIRLLRREEGIVAFELLLVVHRELVEYGARLALDRLAGLRGLPALGLQERLALTLARRNDLLRLARQLGEHVLGVLGP